MKRRLQIRCGVTGQLAEQLQKWKNNAGETLTETLLAMMIAVLGLMILPGAILAAARINDRAEGTHMFMEEGRGTTENTTIKLELESGSGTTVELTGVTVKKDTYDGHSFYYYR